MEEETGAVCISRSRITRGVTVSGTDAGPSTLTPRYVTAGATGGSTDDTGKVLPDFTVGGYEDTLKTCQREAKIGCVIIVSDEHDDVPEFKR